MIGQHLGHTIDIHGGGQDLIFPHHENEIAQGTCAHGTLYCRTWVHNSFVTVEGQKMSKSLGNVLLVRDLLSQAPGEAIRLALLSTHYRKPLDWNALRLESAREMLAKYYDSLAQVEHIASLPQTAPDAEVLEALRNDLNIPGALVRLRVLVSELNDADTDAKRAHRKSVLLTSARMMGLLQQEPQASLAALRPMRPVSSAPLSDNSRITALLAAREDARRSRDFAKADSLRDEIALAGFIVEDTPAGQVVRHAIKESV
ncbi:MAG: hypothetical protein EBV46_02405 [Burkholderiaceae bacterium]|nr:hypothetical protein [Burkholderiaceae bacterium]